MKVEGRKSYVEMNLDMVRLAKRLHRYPVNGRRRSLREVSEALALAGYVASSGKPFDPKSIARMVEHRRPVLALRRHSPMTFLRRRRASRPWSRGHTDEEKQQSHLAGCLPAS